MALAARFADAYEPGLAEDAQMFGDGCTADLGEASRDLTGSERLTLAQQFENGAAGGIGAGLCFRGIAAAPVGDGAAERAGRALERGKDGEAALDDAGARFRCHLFQVAGVENGHERFS